MYSGEGELEKLKEKKDYDKLVEIALISENDDLKADVSLCLVK